MTPNGPQKPSKNRWKFDAVPGVSQRSQILAEPKENHGFSRVRGLAFGSVFGGILVAQRASKIHANSIGFLDGFLEQKGSPEGSQNAIKNPSKNQWKNGAENVPKNGPKRAPKMTPQIK